MPMQKQIFEFMGRRIELWVHPDPDHMGRMIRGNRQFYELDVLMKCRELYLPGSAIIDVGANIGNLVGGFFGGFVGTLLAIPIAGSIPLSPSRYSNVQKAVSPKRSGRSSIC